MIFTGGYTGTYSGVETWTDCTGTHSIAWGISGGCTREERKPQKKNPYLLLMFRFLVPLTIGSTQKKKESFKKASQVVISKVGVIDE